MKYKKHLIKWSTSKNVYHIWDANSIPCGYGRSIEECKTIIDAREKHSLKKKDKSKNGHKSRK